MVLIVPVPGNCLPFTFQQKTSFVVVFLLFYLYNKNNHLHGIINNNSSPCNNFPTVLDDHSGAVEGPGLTSDDLSLPFNC